MLRHLHVRNLAVLEEASVDFEPGLNVVTGETGAVKSLVVDSMNLLGGARASSDLIRTGAEQLLVTGIFDLPEDRVARQVLGDAGIECPEPELVVRREVARNGRNRVFVNDQPSTLRLLAEIGPSLLRVFGQRDELGLLEADLQRSWLDRQGGEAGVAALATCAGAFGAWSAVAERLARLEGDQRTRRELAELLRFQAAEIDRAAPVAGEEVELLEERQRLRHADEIGGALALALELLAEDDEAVTARLARTQHALEPVAEWIGEAGSWLGELDESRIRLQELAATIASFRDRVEPNPLRLNAVEDRLAVLERLFRKYGQTAAEVLARRQAIAGELDDLEVSDDRRAQLIQETSARLEEYRTAATELSRLRRGWARQLERGMERELEELALPKARFSVALDVRRRDGSGMVVASAEVASVEASSVEASGIEVDFHSWGYDVASFLFSSNPGEELRPLAKVASGGELSRVHLALQTTGAGEAAADASTLVFDEVDAGIGGAVAAVVGRKLRRLGEAGQILSVTHLPQVASQGHHHFRVAKGTSGGRTRVTVEALSQDLRVEELARMLGGESVTETARQHAAEMLLESSKVATTGKRKSR